MARDIDVDVNVKDNTKPGLDAVERSFRKSGDNIKKEYDRFGKGAGDGLIKAIGSVSPKLAAKLAEGLGDGARLGAPLLISGMAAALPALSGLIGAAVTGGAAGAGILGGVALAARDARVLASGQALASNLLSGLTEKAGVFVPPVLASIDIIDRKFKESGDSIESIFEDSARFVEPLTESIGSAMQSIIEGIEIAVSRAGPVVDAIGEGIEQTGETVKGFMDQLSANGEANATVLRETFSALNGVLALTGSTLNVVTSIFAQLNEVMPLSLLGTINELFNGTAEEAEAAAAAEKRVADENIRVAAAAAAAAKDHELYNKALEDNARAAEAAASANASLFDDETRVGEATDRATEAAKKNGRTLDANTSKGRANRQSLSGLASAMNGYRSNLEKAGSSTSKVNGVLNTQRSRLIAAAQGMGATRSQAARLADQLLGIKPRSVSVKVNGSAQAASNARNVRQEIDQVRSKSVTLNVNTALAQSRIAAVERRLARVGGANAAANDSFGINQPGQQSRVGGATPIEVNSRVDVNLDGRPFRQYTEKRVRDDLRREAFRNRVGKR